MAETLRLYLDRMSTSRRLTVAYHPEPMKRVSANSVLLGVLPTNSWGAASIIFNIQDTD